MRVKYGKEIIEFDCTSAQNIGDVKRLIAEANALRPETVKLMRSGKVLDDGMVLDDAEMTVVMMATKLATKVEDETPRHLQTRLIDDLTQRRPRAASNKKKLTLSDSHFGAITPLEGLPMRDKAYSILLSLATDSGIVAIMRKYGWNVPTLAELYPEGEVGISEVCVLGLNENKGQRILLRIRTDDLQGFRRYDSMRQVLIHELTHNVWSDHDSNFYMFMRQLQKESIALDWERASKGKRLNGVQGKIDYAAGGDESSEGEQEQAPRVLDEDNRNSIFKLLPARMMAGQAALLRLTREEQEVQDGCGCGAAHVQDSNSKLETEKRQENSSFMAGSASVGEKGRENDITLCLPCADDDGEGWKASSIASAEAQHEDPLKPAAEERMEVEKEQERGDEEETIEDGPVSVSVSVSVDGANIRRLVLGLCDEAIAMNQQFSESAYTAEKLSSLSSLLLALLTASSTNSDNSVDDVRGESAACFEEACECLALVQTIMGNARDPSKRSLNKASKVVRKLEGVGLQLLLCLGFTEAAAEGRLVLRLYDESFAYIATGLMDRTADICREALQRASVAQG